MIISYHQNRSPLNYKMNRSRLYIVFQTLEKKDDELRAVFEPTVFYNRSADSGVVRFSEEKLHQPVLLRVSLALMPVSSSD